MRGTWGSWDTRGHRGGGRGHEGTGREWGHGGCGDLRGI